MGVLVKKYIIIISALLIINGSGLLLKAQRNADKIKYELRFDNVSDDLFHVTIYPPQLTELNKTYNFISTAPGTYKVLDFGRFVKSFEAYDAEGGMIPVKQISVNKWEISDPQKAVQIVYTIEDSYDADTKENRLSPMTGTAIDDKFALINNFGIFGFFENMQKNPIKLKISYPENWSAGTALNISNDGYYYADSFDHFADSPILLGELTHAATDAGGIKVEMFSFSDSEEIYADTLLKLCGPILNATAEFIGYNPVDRYSFLMIFMSLETYQRQNLWGAGAHEHSYSSVYGIPISPETLKSITGTISHEFFHIMTPLNLHSDIIENYNWAEPIASRHLWLYEGLTEWASEILQFRGGLITMKEYLKETSMKINRTKRFNTGLSLTEVSEKSYDPAMTMEYLNFYQKGSLVNSLLDILLLDLSDGEKGLREVFIDLSKKYGKNKSFKDDEFFKIFSDNTYPEVGLFFDKYIKDTLALPIEDYFGRIGVRLIPERIPENAKPRMGLSFMPSENKEVMLRDVSAEAAVFGFKNGDIVVKFLGEDATFTNFGKLIDKSRKLNIGDEYEVLVKRDGEEKLIKAKLFMSIEHNVLEPMENMNARQLKLFDAWKRNMPL